MRLQDALDHFVLQLEADGRSPHTIGNYRRHVALLARWLGATDDLDEVTPQTLARFLTSDVARIDANGVARSASTVNALRTSLRVFFGWLHGAGLVRTNAARLVRRAICSPPPPKTLADDEIERLLATIARDSTPEGKRDHAVFALIAWTGIRLSSAIGIDVEDIDLGRAEIRLRRVKGDRTERVLLGPKSVALLTMYLGDRRSGPAFPAFHGGVLGRRQAARRFELWLERAGLPHRGAHALRHSFATRLYRQTGDVLLVRTALGHRSLESTLVYARADDVLLRAVLVPAEAGVSGG
ncbi:MAG: tyrosine-type recombinase/integrase [Planctomycetes bacterium]|nr:tyrosine-type recombinase/integrase [Planctomycetota bacterium]